MLACAAGEYISVYSQKDSQEADMEKERRAQEHVSTLCSFILDVFSHLIRLTLSCPPAAQWRRCDLCAEQTGRHALRAARCSCQPAGVFIMRPTSRLCRTSMRACRLRQPRHTGSCVLGVIY